MYPRKELSHETFLPLLRRSGFFRAGVGSALPVRAELITVPMVQTGLTSAFQTIGTVVFTDTDMGLEIITRLGELPPGPHGFHIHENPNCSLLQKDGKMVAGLEAGGHYDPQKTGRHLGPGHTRNGHLGDLPVLVADEKGRADHTLLAPGLNVGDIRNRSVIIHAGGDNYADMPVPLGGGGDHFVPLFAPSLQGEWSKNGALLRSAPFLQKPCGCKFLAERVGFEPTYRD